MHLLFSSHRPESPVRLVVPLCQLGSIPRVGGPGEPGVWPPELPSSVRVSSASSLQLECYSPLYPLLPSSSLLLLSSTPPLPLLLHFSFTSFLSCPPVCLISSSSPLPSPSLLSFCLPPQAFPASFPFSLLPQPAPRKWGFKGSLIPAIYMIKPS